MLLSALLHVATAGELTWDVPLVDAPYSQLGGGYTWPSMEQSLQTSLAFYSATHRLLLLYDLDDPRLSRRIATRAVLFAADFALPLLPGGSTWLHEEWHRAVLTSHGVTSHNGVYDLQPGLFVSVDHVDDADLEALKASSPADQVRLSTAGIEALGVLSAELQDRHFHDQPDSYPVPVYWLAVLTNGIYYGLCASPANTAALDAEVQGEGPDPSSRDFTGLDCTGFTYDLFRPDEPYAERGAHPSGTGLDRYRTWDDLDPAEQRWLTRQSRLTWLNLVNPALVEQASLDVTLAGSPLRLGAHLQHLPSPFGYRIGARVLVDGPRLDLTAGVYAAVSAALVRPAASLILHALPWGPTRWTVAGDLWLQPAQLRHDAVQALPGGRARVRVALDVDPRWQPYVELEAKTAGWVPGRVSLAPALMGRGGVTLRVPTPERRPPASALVVHRPPADLEGLGPR